MATLEPDVKNTHTKLLAVCFDTVMFLYLLFKSPLLPIPGDDTAPKPSGTEGSFFDD
jgi:hypothetical protein